MIFFLFRCSYLRRCHYCFAVNWFSLIRLRSQNCLPNFCNYKKIFNKMQWLHKDVKICVEILLHSYTQTYSLYTYIEIYVQKCSEPVFVRTNIMQLTKATPVPTRKTNKLAFIIKKKISKKTYVSGVLSVKLVNGKFRRMRANAVHCILTCIFICRCTPGEKNSGVSLCKWYHGTEISLVALHFEIPLPLYDIGTQVFG